MMIIILLLVIYCYGSAIFGGTNNQLKDVVILGSCNTIDNCYYNICNMMKTNKDIAFIHIKFTWPLYNNILCIKKYQHRYPVQMIIFGMEFNKLSNNTNKFCFAFEKCIEDACQILNTTNSNLILLSGEC